MGLLGSFLLKVRRRQTPFHDRVYRTIRAIRRFELPAPRFVFLPLYYERIIRLELWRNFLRVAYRQPVFRARCASVGRRLVVEQAIPEVTGPLKLILGDDVVIDGVNTFSASKAYDSPVLRIGDQSYIGYGVGIAVSKEVSIGANVLIAALVSILGHDGHPLDPIKRRDQPADVPEDRATVIIENDAWIGQGAIVLKGIRIGEGAVVAAGSVVTKDVPPFTVVAGNPARTVLKIERPGTYSELMTRVSNHAQS